jgi:hypothetical protein
MSKHFVGQEDKILFYSRILNNFMFLTRTWKELFKHRISLFIILSLTSTIHTWPHWTQKLPHIPPKPRPNWSPTRLVRGSSSCHLSWLYGKMALMSVLTHGSSLNLPKPAPRCFSPSRRARALVLNHSRSGHKVFFCNRGPSAFR